MIGGASMRHSLFLLTLAIATAFGGALLAEPAAGSPAPDMTMTRAWNNPNNRTKISDFKGEYVHLIFWATW
jgi:hypothetical protein